MIKSLLFLILAITTFFISSPMAAEKELYPEVRVKENHYLKIISNSIHDPGPDSVISEAGMNGKVLKVKLLFKEYCAASKKERKFDKIANDPRSSTEDIARAFAEEISNGADYIVPVYKCNPKMKIFLTTYEKNGKEWATDGHYISATPQKLEIFPGEIIETSFFLIEDVNSSLEDPIFQIWLPK